MPGLIGRKIGMTSVFSADGKNVPCTVIEAGWREEGEEHHQTDDGYLQEGQHNTEGPLGRVQV